MHRLGQAIADARHRAEQVGAWAQVRDFAQEFQRMRLGLDGIGFRIVDPADHFDARCLDLERLSLALRRRQRAGCDHRATGGEPLHFGLVIGQRRRRDHLDRGEARAVADVDKRQPGLGVAPGANPTADRDFAAGGHLARERVFDADRCHALNSYGFMLINKRRSLPRRGTLAARFLSARRSAPGNSAARCKKPRGRPWPEL